MQTHYDDFFEDIFIEMEDKYGEIEEMNVCDNLGDHLVGNVYVKVRICVITVISPFVQPYSDVSSVPNVINLTVLVTLSTVTKKMQQKPSRI